jgi:hypothetical protein
MLSVGTSRMSSERQVWFKFSKVYSIIKREENSHANRCIYRLLIIARVYKQHRRSVLYVCFLWPFEFRRAPATFTHLFLIGFCVCVLSFLVCCFANVAIDRRHDRPILPSYTRLVRMSIYSVMGRPFWNIQWRARRRRWLNVRPDSGPCKPFRSSIRPASAESRPSTRIATLFATPSSTTRAWWPPRKVGYIISSFWTLYYYYIL